jgi:hypothetical protein
MQVVIGDEEFMSGVQFGTSATDAGEVESK